MRFDRFATLRVIHPMRRVAAGRKESCLPVLMYHSISNDAEEGLPYFRTCTRPDVFARQVKLLTDQGYEIVNLRQGLEWFAKSSQNGSQKDGRKLVVFTFDDGYRDFLTSAAAVLLEAGASATIFLATGHLGMRPQCFEGRECMSWAEVGELYRSGFEFGSHTVTHPKLVDLPWSAIEDEVIHSKEHIEQHLGDAMGGFAFPYAFPQADKVWAKRFVELLERAGYQYNATTVIGRVQRHFSPYLLKRLPVNSCDDDALLLAKMEGDYDWLEGPQRLFKQLKRVCRPAASR